MPDKRDVEIGRLKSERDTALRDLLYAIKPSPDGDPHFDRLDKGSLRDVAAYVREELGLLHEMYGEVCLALEGTPEDSLPPDAEAGREVARLMAAVRHNPDLAAKTPWIKGSPTKAGTCWLAWPGQGGGYNAAVGVVYDGYPANLSSPYHPVEDAAARITAWRAERLAAVGHTRYLFARIDGFGVRDLQTTMDPIIAYIEIPLPPPLELA